MILNLLIYLLSSAFGRNLRPVKDGKPEYTIPPHPQDTIEAGAEEILAEEAEETNDSKPDVESPQPPPVPQIIVPDKANADSYGPASSIARAVVAAGHKVFEDNKNPMNLNIVAIRTAKPEFNRFRCRLAHFHKDPDGEWHLKSWPITTFPGDRYTITRLLNPKGVAILAAGQYSGVYALDRHRGVYEALCQRLGPVRVYRDGNRNRVYDMVPSTIMSGMYGINVHATENPDDGISKNLSDAIGAASAGCLVFARVTDFVEARNEWREARSYWSNKFTLTLIDEEDLDDAGTLPKESPEGQKSDKESWMPPQPFTLGIRNRNLLNVKQNPRNPWKYSTDADSKGHTIFPNFASGIRAGILTLRTYWKTHKIRTLMGICSRWAPSSDTLGSIEGNPSNNPSAYASFLANRLGVSPSSQLMLFHDDGSVRSADQLFKLVAGMVAYENHAGVDLPRSVFDAALAMLD